METVENVRGDRYCAFFVVKQLVQALFSHLRWSPIDLRAMERRALSPHSTD